MPFPAKLRATEMGYWLGKDVQGRGLMGLVVNAMLDYCFGELKLIRVSLHADVENIRLQRLAERLGFQKEGLERASWELRGEFRDNFGYAMLASDWQRLRETGLK